VSAITYILGLCPYGGFMPSSPKTLFVKLTLKIIYMNFYPHVSNLIIVSLNARFFYFCTNKRL